MYDTSLWVFQSDIHILVLYTPEYGLNLYLLAEVLVCVTPRYFQCKSYQLVPVWL